jgi:uncharacterized protein (DUF1800 family)
MRLKSIARYAAILPLVATLAAGAQSKPNQTKPAKHKPAAHPASHAEEASAPLTPEERAVQMLNRFTFGPRPGEIDAVLKTGSDAWFEQQLNPQSIPDPVSDKRMGEFPSLYLAPSDLLVQFPSNQIIRQTAEGKRPYPADPVLGAAYEVLVMKYNRRQAEQKAQQAAGDIPAPEMTDAQKKEQRQQQQAQAQVLADQMLAYPKDQRMQAILKMPVDQRAILTEFVPDPQKTLLLNDFNPRQKELFAMMAGGPDALHVIDGELQQAKLLRAVLSERQLLEVMTDFWYNHFNVDVRKEAAQWYTPTYERDAIRAHALGKFGDLLLATAQHPAMLYYLDNWSSIGPDSEAAGKGKKPNQRGLNENYGREVMELHTVGVDGGYTQADVTNLAKILTGWTIDQPQQGGGFVFDPRKHEPGSVRWFGQTMQDNGYLEGRQALLWLAAQPQTARHISYQLAQRFVADDPPPALVDGMAKTFLDTGGDIREVLRTMVRSPEFNSQKYYRNQVKTPLEFVASVFRATETDPSNSGALTQAIARMGEPLYQMQPPTGYSTTADHWMNSGALVDRLNFSMQFAGSKVGGIKFDAPRLLAAGLLARPALSASSHGEGRAQAIAMTATGLPSGQDEALNLMEEMLIPSQVSAKTNAVIRRELAAGPTDAAAGPAPAASSSSMQPNPAQNQRPPDPTQTLDTMTALILGSPEFQMH